MKVCPKCKSENFDQLDSYASYLTCRDCGAEFYLPVEYCKECEALTAQIEGMYTREDEALEVFKMHYEVKDETLAELVRGLFRALGNVEQQCRELEKELEEAKELAQQWQHKYFEATKKGKGDIKSITIGGGRDD